uniref:Transposase (Putative), gypsy type n=1 Tax=Tanacetum cinerariifolium TaxID=118510 RepID=A0A699HMM7_TANCI|nr:hypothetical protein [Tanacetum cinerariifolium]
MLNVEVGVAAVPTLPMVTSSVSATPEHESGAPADSITRLNICTISASKRSFVVPSVMTKVVVTSHAVNIHPVPEIDTEGLSYSAKQDLSMGSRELNSETMHQVFVPQWNVLNNSLLDDYDVSREFVDHLAPLALFSQIQYCLSERKRLESECEKQASFLKARDDEVSTAEATEKMHASEIDALKHRNVSFKNKKESLDEKVTKLQSSVFAKDLKLKDLNVVVSSLRSQKDGHVDQDSGYERLKEQVEEFQDVQINIVNDKVAQLDAGLLEMALHLEEKFYPHLLTTISGPLGSAISHAIKKGMNDGLSVGIDHGKAGRNLADIVAYNPATEANYNSALQRLRETPLVDPLSAENLTGKAGTSDGVPATTVTTTALSTTFASASSFPLITIEEYKIVSTDGLEDSQGNGQGNVAYFPIVEFEKEELDTTPEHYPPSQTSLVMVLPGLSFVATIDRGHVWPFCIGSCT